MACLLAEGDRLPPIQAHVILPRVEVVVFQCGFVEKNVPYGHIERAANQLLQVGLLAVVLDQFNFTTRTVFERNNSICQLPIKMETKLSSGQFFQVVDKQCTNIGLSKGEASSRCNANWDELTALVDSYDLKHVVNLEVPEITAWLTLKNRPKNPPPKKISASQRTAPNNVSINPILGQKADELVVKIGPISTVVGLCQPLDSVDNRWPLYDLLAPSVCAWIHVVHRFGAGLTEIVDGWNDWRQLAMAKLMIDTLDCQVISNFISFF